MEKTMIIAKLREVKTTVFAEILEKIEKIEKVSTNFSHTNLKLHNVSYYLYEAEKAGIITSGQNIQTFQEICEREYEYFQEWEQENLNYVSRSYIGRTSSFYYNSNWYGEILDNDLLENILEGKPFDNNSNDVFSSLDFRLYTYLINDISIESEFLEFDVVEFDEWLSEEENTLHNINDDLETFYEIVLEAEKAYTYLSEFKTEKNEYELAKHYLEFEISHYYSVDFAENLFDEILDNIEYLNEISKLEFGYVEINGEYELQINSNEKVFNIETNIETSHELSTHTIECISFELKRLIDTKFKL